MDILHLYKSEVELIRSVIDLAASRRVPINAKGDYDEWLTFDSISEALDDLCKQLHISRQVEQHCYQTLLRMSAESENHLTWWEKIEIIHKYLPHASHATKSKHSPSNRSTHHQQASMSHHSLPTPMPHLIRLVEPERTLQMRPSMISSTSPGTLLEANNLSMLLNDTYAFQTNVRSNLSSGEHLNSSAYATVRSGDHRYSSNHVSARNSNTYMTATPVQARTAQDPSFSEQGWMSTHGVSNSARRIHFRDEISTPQTSGLDRDNSVFLQSVIEKVSSIEKETQHTKDILANMYGSGNKDTSTPHREEVDNTAGATAYVAPGHYHIDRGNWTLSPSIIHDQASTLPDTPFANKKGGTNAGPDARAQPAIQGAAAHKSADDVKPSREKASAAEASTSASPSRRTTKSRAFSDLLRHSGAMNKYLGIGRAAGDHGPSAVTAKQKTLSPVRDTDSIPSPRPARPTNRARSTSPPRSNPAPMLSGRGADAPVGIQRPLHAERKTALFDSPDPPPRPPQHHHFHFDDTSPDPDVGDAKHSTHQPATPSRSYSAAAFIAATPSRVVPLVLQGHHGAGGVYTPEGHINTDALDFDPRLLHGPYALEAEQLNDAEGLVHTISSTTRLLVIFHRWLLRRSDHADVHFSDSRNAALMLVAHFASGTDFVSSLFGLEQWLRDKMKLIAATEAKAYIFRVWNLHYGVSAKSRMYWRTRRLHLGFESFLEYGMKRRMHRKNALHALAARRRHTNPAYMSPVLRHRPMRPSALDGSGFADDDPAQDGDNEESSAAFAQLTSKLHNLSDLSGLNKYSSVDMTMFNASQRQQQKRAQYLTSLSIQEIINDAKSALVMYGRGGDGDSLKVKTREYQQAQDAVALLFAFRRLYHRSIYISRQQKVRAMLRTVKIKSVFSMWKEMWTARLKVEVALEPHVQRVVENMKFVKKRIALRKFQDFVHYGKREKEHLSHYQRRIRSKPVFLKAIHLIRCAAYVKCFNALKTHYVTHSPTPVHLRQADNQKVSHSLRSGFGHWRRWYTARNSSRLNGFQAESSRHILMAMLLQRSAIWHLVQQNNRGSAGASASSSTAMSTDTFLNLPAIRHMHFTAPLVNRTVQLTQLRRALHKLRMIGSCTRVYFSLTELRFAQALCRRSMPSERRKYMRMVNDGSCRILPSMRGALGARLLTSGNTAAVIEHHHSRHHHPAKTNNARRSSEEKPYRLVAVHPHTLRLFMRTIYNSTPLEHHEDSEFLNLNADSLTKTARLLTPLLRKPLVTLDGTVLSNTPQLLRMMRKWRVQCDKSAYLRKLGDKVRKARELVVIREKYLHWIEAFQHQRECNRCNKRLAMEKLHRFILRNRVICQADKKTKRGLVARHWSRLAAAHTHHTELRRLHAGHFYNSIADGSAKVLNFIASHHSVPFSVRHFMQHYPSYRFPIYRQYDAAYWEHSHQTSAHQAILVISQHHKVYNHENHLAHHLELFHHHHQQEFRADGTARAVPVTGGQQSSQRRRPMHLTPGALLGPQPFSVSASIASVRYNGGGRGRSASPQKTNHRPSVQEEAKAASKAYMAAVQHPPSKAGGDVPAAAELASAAVFMSHWISECLEQYYALRRGLYLLRRHAAASTLRKRRVKSVYLAQQAYVIQVLRENRRDRVLFRSIRLQKLRRWIVRMRTVAVTLKYKRKVMHKYLMHMNHVYHYALVLRTWDKAWKRTARVAWDKLVAHTALRQSQFSRITASHDAIVLSDTMRVMCAVVSANAWRRRRARVMGLRAFVSHYNDRVLLMDRANTVRLYATIKHFAALKDTMLGLLKQRLSDTIGMNYCKKRGLIRGFLALYSAIQQPHRLIHETTLKDRMLDSIEGFREYHSTYCTHKFRVDVDLSSDNPAVRTGMAAHRRRLFQHKQHMFNLRLSVSPYISTVLPLPSPVPPAQTISTTVRRASMLRERSATPSSRISLDTLTEAASPTPEAVPTPVPSIIVSDRRASNTPVNITAKSKSFMSVGSTTANTSSAAQLLFGSVATSPPAASVKSVGSVDRRSTIDSSRDVSVVTYATSSTLAAMAQRRRSAQSLSMASADDESGVSGRTGSPRCSSIPGAASVGSPYEASRRSSTTSITTKTPFGGPIAATTGSFRYATPAQSFQSASSWNTTSNISNTNISTSNVSHSYTDEVSTRRSSLHDAHAQAASAPTTVNSTVNSEPLSISLGNTMELQPMAPQSILITSPAYTGTARATPRGDSRIFFSDSSHVGPVSGPGTPAASLHSGRRQSVASQPQLSAFSPAPSAARSVMSRRQSADSLPPRSGVVSSAPSIASRRASVAPSINTGTVSAPMSPLTQYDDTPQSGGSFFFLDENSTDASTMRESADPSRASLRVQRKRTYVMDQRNEETVEHVVQLETAQKKATLVKWLLIHRYNITMRKFSADHSLKRVLSTSWQNLVRQLQISRYQRQQEQRCASHRALTRLSNLTFKVQEGRQILEFAEKYYVVMALKLNLRKWRARTTKSLLSNNRIERGEHFSRKHIFARFLVGLRAKVMRLGHVGDDDLSSPPRQTNHHAYNHSRAYASTTSKAKSSQSMHSGAPKSAAKDHSSGADQGYREDKPEPFTAHNRCTSSGKKSNDRGPSRNSRHAHYEDEEDKAPKSHHKASLTTQSINAMLR